MPFALAVVVLLLPLVLVLLIPLSLVQRYRVGSARRLARGWVATINVVTIGFSTGLFLVVAAVTSVWIPNAFTYALVGLLAGLLLGLLGLALSRWEATPESLHYTPNRWFVLVVTLVVAARVVYGFWRGWQTWGSSPDGASWLVHSGAAGSLAAGAVVLGYYLTYWAGVRRRFKQHRRTVTMLTANRGATTQRSS